MSVQILFRRGTAAEWTSENPILGSGEPGFEIDTGNLKVGDGVSSWNSLSYISGEATPGTLESLTNVTITSPTNGQVLKWNGTAWVNSTDETGSGGTTINSIDDIPGVNITSPTSGQVLKWNGTAWVNDTDLTGGAGSIALNDITDVTISNPVSGQVLKWNGNAWVNDTDNAGSGFGLASRAELQGSTGSIANGASANIAITGYRSYSLLKIQTSAAAWVRIYSNAASRTADSSRLQGTDPAPGSGVIAEVITTGAQTVVITPGAIGFNDESPVTTNIPLRVTNLSGGSANITVTLTALQLEA